MSNIPVCDHVDMPDPWVIQGHGVYYLTFTQGDRIEIWSSKHIEDFNHAQKSLVWKPEGSGWAPGIWAPELHFLGDAWYIYFSGEKPGQGPASHRTLVLRSTNRDPMDPSGWQFMGPLQGVPDHWSIDATVFKVHEELYCCWSGWPLGDNSDKEQDLFIAKLASPTQAIPDTVTVISRPDRDWERPDGGKRGVNEGPTWVSLHGFQGLVYSAHGSWTCDYKLGLLALVGNNPLDPASWKKRDAPLLMSERERGGPYGPGHASFIVAPDGHACICMFHCTKNVDDGWDNRKARCMELKAKDFSMEAPHCCCASGEGGGHHIGGFVGKAINKIKSL
ncbi:hypothetical protein GLX27_004291 [Malassezia furfur]|uniref:Uncharacterized protein n=1 Tax=Malassezia furfur TaxID=55194 RepID=A0ABY8EYJ3_MALFU|nr:hypothetical protein CBS14141_003862 [Malassezia furfur]WFD49607.1 hypothetical protein GLX27_004291 [Malassezia furfur]